MKIAYFDCLSGISGDMTLGALVDAGVSFDALNNAVQSLGLPECRLVAEEVHKRGFRATQVTVTYAHEHAHRGLGDILPMIEKADISERQKHLAAQIFRKLGQAEAKVHGMPLDEVHFHEVGAADSIADIVGAAVGLDLLEVERIIASRIPTGTGTVRMAHGRVSIPAPATAELLRGIPTVATDIEFELTTPTGAAILATLADQFGPIPAMTVERIGLGAGQRDLDEQPNVLRLLVGRLAGFEEPEAVAYEEDDSDEEVVWIVETNLDDASGEMIGHCTERLWEIDVLDVFSTPIQMKKMRPGVRLTVLCREESLEAVETVLFRETTTLGVRRWPTTRRVLPRREDTVDTCFGPVQGKVARLPDGEERFAPEYEACREVAQRRGVALREVYEAAVRAWPAG